VIARVRLFVGYARLFVKSRKYKAKPILMKFSTHVQHNKSRKLLTFKWLTIKFKFRGQNRHIEYL